MAGIPVKTCFGLLITALMAIKLSAQNPPGLNFNYSQNNNTYVWENSYNKIINIGEYYSELNLNTESTLMKKPYKRWQETLAADYRGNYKLKDGLSLVPFITIPAIPCKIVWYIHPRQNIFCLYRLLSTLRYLRLSAIKGFNEKGKEPNAPIGDSVMAPKSIRGI
jgi:hypothetical protein